MHRVELKVLLTGSERLLQAVVFLMHRVELKAGGLYQKERRRDSS